MTIDCWPPLLALGEHALDVSRALAKDPVVEVEARLTALEAEADPRLSVGLSSARYALALRVGLPTAKQDPDAIRCAFLAAGDPVAACFVLVEQALALGPVAGSALLRDIAPSVLGRSLLLAAAVARAEGSLARSSGDLRASLAFLGRSVDLAEASGSARELVRSRNTLGTTYASLGLATSARGELVPALELASAIGEAQSAAVAEGQLAALALEEGNASRAVRSLSRQAATARHLGDVHALARALSLQVEAHGALSNLEEVKTCADEARSLARIHGDPWTRRQALFATLYEAEVALAHGRLERGSALLDDVHGEGATFEGPVRARLALSFLWRRERLALPLSAEDFEELAVALRASPRPAWVERALLLASRQAASPAHRMALALRATLVRECREACRATLSGIATVDREASLDRAIARGRDLLSVTRLALAPLLPWETPLTFVEAGSPRDLDRLIGVVLGRAASAGIEDLLVSAQGPLRAAFARCGGGSLAGLVEDLGAHAGALVFSTTAVLRVTDDPTGPLALVPASCHVPPHPDGARDPVSSPP